MKRSNFIYSMVCLITSLALVSGNLYAQDGGAQEPGDTKKTEKTEKLIGTYLDKAHAKIRAEHLEAEMKKVIYMLQVMVNNFGEEKDKSALKSIIGNHIEGKKELFKRHYLKSDQIFQGVKKDVKNVLTDLTARYEERANEILSRCAESIVDKEIGIGSTRDAITSDTAARTSQKITRNRIRLLVAYDQLNMADRFKFQERLDSALTHYRLAKLHGINILVDLVDTESEKDKLRTEFKADLADGENLIAK